MERMSALLRIPARGLMGRGWFARLLLGAAVVAMLMPSLGALEPNLAGWSPTHGHVYADGAPVPHTHPWDSTATGSAAGQAAGVTFTWDDSSAVFAATVPVTVVLAMTATLLVALERLRPAAPRPVYARIPTPPPR